MVEAVEDSYRLLFASSGTPAANGETYLIKNEKGSFVNAVILDDISMVLGKEAVLLAVSGNRDASAALSRAAVIVKAASAVALDMSLLDL
jgi:hypothetical protein